MQAIAFAKLRAGDKMEWQGYDAGNKAIKLKKVDMEEAIAEWREVLARLAGEFAAGTAMVSPKSFPDTCKYCAQRMLCRLNPERMGEDAEETGD